ncbi:MAG: PilC/PilY family type IV pilus protein [Chromatiales bacterium]|nr:PilC/PilY family type IV pilus protein [Chromatiales bacterium]
MMPISIWQVAVLPIQGLERLWRVRIQEAIKRSGRGFRSPLTAADFCANTYLIFVGNPNSSGPTTDDSDNSAILRSLITAAGGTPDRMAGESSGTPIGIPNFTTISGFPENIEFTSEGCYNNAGQCERSDDCANITNCRCDNPISTGCANGNKYRVIGSITPTTIEATGTYNNDKGRNWNFDDWSKFMYGHGIPVGTGSDRIKVITYTIDVFNRQQNNDHTGLMLSAARVGGGRYFAARNQEAIETAFDDIFSEILSVNSTFASAALPISATNRSQNENQVFIGMFRPDKDAKPGWFGNLKRYQLSFFDGQIDLADASTPPRRAVNLQTGFVTECASSFWTVDSSNYWSGKGVSPDPASQCIGSTTNRYSDLPDGPFVEKGAAAQKLRDMSDLNERPIMTLSATALTPLTPESSGLSAELANYVLGWNAGSTAARHTIHGDVIHSRPLPVNYGADGVTVYYGANDGVFRAISANTGEERWSFVAPEHLIDSGARFARLRNETPLIDYPGMVLSGSVAKKDYFFDGLIGQVIRYDTSNNINRAWIYPTMRRGGRMLYALDVTDPDAPDLLWRRGCPNLTNDTGCSADWTGIGQTWSFPNAAYIAGYESGNKPVIVMGGGYTACEDLADDNVPSSSDCTTDSKGRQVYVIDAENGNIIRAFPTDRAVAADVSLIDVVYNGKADYAYAADTGGNLYRISFINPQTREPLAPVNWSIEKIAYTSGGHRKFLYGPGVMAYRGAVYLALGSGNRERPLETNYPYLRNVQDRFYVFLDTPSEVIAEGEADYPFDLDSEDLYDYSQATTCDADGIIPGTDKKGWFMDLPNRGEQTVTSALIIGGMATFSTTRPGGATTATAGDVVCSRPIGIAEGYWVNLFNASGAIGVVGTCDGDRSSEFAGGGIPPSPVEATVPIDGVPTTVVIGAPQRQPEAGGSTPISPQIISPAIPENRQRVFWNVLDIDR